MPFPTSSMLGVDLNSANSTAQFALNTKVLGNNNTEWQYVFATAALTTGQIVNVFAGGTAIAFTTAILAATPTSNTGPLDLGVVQFPISSSQYGFVAKRGNALQVLVSGTCPPGNAAGYGFAPTAGALLTGGLVAVGQTAAGFFPYTSGAAANGGATAGLSIVLAVLTYPRPLVGVPQA